MVACNRVHAHGREDGDVVGESPHGELRDNWRNFDTFCVGTLWERLGDVLASMEEGNIDLLCL